MPASGPSRLGEASCHSNGSARGPPWSPLLGLPLPSWQLVDGTVYGRDDDEDQHSAVLWPSYGKVEAREPVEKEYETKKHLLWECHKFATVGVSTLCPRCAQAVPTR